MKKIVVNVSLKRNNKSSFCFSIKDHNVSLSIARLAQYLKLVHECMLTLFSSLPLVLVLCFPLLYHRRPHETHGEFLNFT